MAESRLQKYRKNPNDGTMCYVVRNFLLRKRGEKYTKNILPITSGKEKYTRPYQERQLQSPSTRSVYSGPYGTLIDHALKSQTCGIIGDHSIAWLLAEIKRTHVAEIGRHTEIVECPSR